MSTDQVLAQVANESSLATDELQKAVEKIEDLHSTLDNRISQKEQQIDVFIEQNAQVLTTAVETYYDNGYVFSKNSMNITADPDNNHMSTWMPVQGAQSVQQVANYFRTSRLTYIHASTIYSMIPGSQEAPPFITDWSRTQVQFLVADRATTSADINNKLTELELIPALRAGWSFDSYCVPVDVIHIASWDKILWCRYINVVPSSAPDQSASPQDITTFGGDTYFMLDRVAQYTNIVG